jgi:hypothetical protein
MLKNMPMPMPNKNSRFFLRPEAALLTTGPFSAADNVVGGGAWSMSVLHLPFYSELKLTLRSDSSIPSCSKRLVDMSYLVYYFVVGCI